MGKTNLQSKRTAGKRPPSLRPREGRLFDVVNVTLMSLLIFVTLFPFWYCLVGSFNQGFDYLKGGVYLWPRKFSLDNYWIVFRQEGILSAYKITILRTLIGTVSHVLVTALFAYGFSRKYLKGKAFYAIFGLITMYFQGGLIPKYILYKNLGLLDNFLVYILPGLLTFYHVIIMQAFYRTIPEAINESAMMDGAGEYRIFFWLILPLAKPVVAAITLFEGVRHWNSFFDSMVFTTSDRLQTIQVYLMRVIKSAQAASQMANESAAIIPDRGRINSETIKLATMIVTTAPILAIYPFLQKYFVKGIMIGAIKG
jgi:putative aldouronate transport system permease protein